MKIEEIICDLDSQNKVNETLSALYNIIVDKAPDFISKLAYIIQTPDLIEDINNFALLLADLKCEEFINPLSKIIMKGEVGQSTWLSSYMYAMGDILEESTEDFDFSEEFINLLGHWLSSTNGGEISWKAALILSNIKHPTCYKYYIMGVKDKKQFHQTRIACLKGLVNQYGSKEMELYYELSKEDEPVLKEAVNNAISFLSDN